MKRTLIMMGSSRLQMMTLTAALAAIDVQAVAGNSVGTFDKEKRDKRSAKGISPYAVNKGGRKVR